MAKRVHIFMLLLCWTFTPSIDCECSVKELTELKETIFEELIIIAKTILKFTNSSDAEKSQLQPIFEELASRHKEAQTIQPIEKNTPSPIEDAFRDLPNWMPSNNDDVTDVASHDDHVIPSASHVPASDTVTPVSEPTPVSIGTMNFKEPKDRRAPPDCRFVGADCSPQNLIFCCDGLVCRRDRRFSSYGKCRF